VEVEDAGGPVCRRFPEKNQKTVPSPQELERAKKQKKEARRQWLQERRQYDEIVVKVCILGHIKDPYREKVREAIRNRDESYSLSIVKVSSGLMHLAREMYRDVTDI